MDKKKKNNQAKPDMEAAEMMNPVLGNEMTGAFPFFVPLLDDEAYSDLLDPEADMDYPEGKLIPFQNNNASINQDL